MKPLCRSRLGWTFALLAVAFAHSAPAAEPADDPAGDDVRRVAEIIDRHLADRWQDEGVTPAPLATDAEFLRRVHLDIVGKIPTVAEVRRFLADDSPDKRRAVVDRLLESPAYVTNFTSVWRRVLIPEADSDLQARFLMPGFEAWLREQFTADAHYDEMAREILTLPLGQRNERDRSQLRAMSQGSPIAFYQAKDVAPANLAAATSRTFLGVRIECAQCHDHPFDAWEREDFWSFAAFYAGIMRANPKSAVLSGVIELSDRREIAIPGTDSVVQATYLDGSEPLWRFRVSARQTLAEWVTAKDNPYFARTGANRMWAHFFGIGIVDPVDDFSANNPPSHPELLGDLAREFAAHDFDFKFLIRAVTASRAYQLSSKRPGESQSDPRLFARQAVRGMRPEQLYESLLVATGNFERYQPQQGYSLGGPRGEFLELFADADDDPVNTRTTILQALAMMNGGAVAAATDLENSRTLAAVLDYPLMTDAERIETLFLATLSRPPRDDERERFLKYVESGGPQGDRRAALSDVFWTLLNSSEFLFNH